MKILKVRQSSRLLIEHIPVFQFSPSLLTLIWNDFIIFKSFPHYSVMTSQTKLL